MTRTATDLNAKLAAKAGAQLPTERPKTMADSVKSFLESHRDELSKALPQHVSLDRLNRIAISAINRTPMLGQCNKASLVGAILISSQLGLELNTPLGHAWLIPYKRSVKGDNGWTELWEAQFQLGYQGVIDLAYRTGLYETIYAEAVYENDEFSFCYGLDKSLKHVPTDGDPGELKGVYAVYKLKSGGKDFKYWPVSKVRAHAARYSQSFDTKAGDFRKKSAWADSFEGMAKVPVLKDLLKIAPKSIEFAKQLSLDGSIKAGIAPDMSEVESVEVEYSRVEPADSQQPEAPETSGISGEVPMSDAEIAAIREQEMKEHGGGRPFLDDDNFPDPPGQKK